LLTLEFLFVFYPLCYDVASALNRLYSMPFSFSLELIPVLDILLVSAGYWKCYFYDCIYFALIAFTALAKAVFVRPFSLIYLE
jgi:hypothetical protein